MEEIGAKVCSLLIGVEGFDGGDPSLGLENMWAEREMRSEENGEE